MILDRRHDRRTQEQVTGVYQALDSDGHAAGRVVSGWHHDFSSYRALACQAKSPVRTVHEVSVRRHQEFIFLDIRADGFLHHMVRNIAGVLIAIGRGEQKISWAEAVLQLRDRTLGGMTAPAAGLYLVKVQYDDKYRLCPEVNGLPLVWVQHERKG